MTPLSHEPAHPSSRSSASSSNDGQFAPSGEKVVMRCAPCWCRQVFWGQVSDTQCGGYNSLLRGVSGATENTPPILDCNVVSERERGHRGSSVTGEPSSLAATRMNTAVVSGRGRKVGRFCWYSAAVRLPFGRTHSSLKRRRFLWPGDGRRATQHTQDAINLTV